MRSVRGRASRSHRSGDEVSLVQWRERHSYLACDILQHLIKRFCCFGRLPLGLIDSFALLIEVLLERLELFLLLRDRCFLLCQLVLDLALLGLVGTQIRIFGRDS